MAVSLNSVLAASDGSGRDLRGYMRAAVEAIPLEPVDGDINDVDAFRADAAVRAYTAALELTGNVEDAIELYKKVHAWAVRLAPAPCTQAYELLHGKSLEAARLRRMAVAAVSGEPRGPRKAEFTVASWRASARRCVCHWARAAAEAHPEFEVEAFELFNAAMEWASSSARMS